MLDYVLSAATAFFFFFFVIYLAASESLIEPPVSLGPALYSESALLISVGNCSLSLS